MYAYTKLQFRSEWPSPCNTPLNQILNQIMPLSCKGRRLIFVIDVNENGCMETHSLQSPKFQFQLHLIQ